jgi:hypothetical protein
MPLRGEKVSLATFLDSENEIQINYAGQPLLTYKYAGRILRGYGLSVCYVHRILTQKTQETTGFKNLLHLAYSVALVSLITVTFICPG